MMDASNQAARTIATIAVCGVASVHCTMNAHFGWGMGSTDLERYLFATFGVCLDVCKVFALAFAAYSWDRGRKFKATCCVVVWLTTVCYSGLAAIGFAALARDTVVASRSGDVDEYRDTVSERKRLLEQMEEARVNPMWQDSYGCTQYAKVAPVKAGAERNKSIFCSMYWQAEGRFAETKPVVRKASMTVADPQTALLARISGRSREQVSVALSVFLAFVAEIVSALGTWTFSSSRRKPDRRVERQAQRPKLVVSNA